jgi:outer membrane lipoprotein carrier protein
LLVGDGEKVWIYDPDLRQVTVKKVDAAIGSTPAALLVGGDALEKNFTLARGRRRARASTGSRRPPKSPTAASRSCSSALSGK